MRPEFCVIFTLLLGKPCLWAQSKAGMRSVAPFFMIAAAASEPELLTVLRQIGRIQGRKLAQMPKPLERAHALICNVLPPASNGLLTAIAASSEDIDEGSCRESSASRCESPDIQCSLSAC